MKQKSHTDWTRVRAIKEDDPIPYDSEDAPCDPNDAGATKAYLNAAIERRSGVRGPQKSPTKQRITIRLSSEVVEHFRSTGNGWQARIDAALLKSIQHKVK